MLAYAEKIKVTSSRARELATYVVALISTYITEMEIMINELKMVGTKTAMNTPVMWDRKSEVLFETILQEVSSFVYLGRELNMVRYLASEKSRRSHAAWPDFNSIREVSNQIGYPDPRVTIFNASELTVLCYGTETRPEQKATSCSTHSVHHALEIYLLKTNMRQQTLLRLRSSLLRDEPRLMDLLQRKHWWAVHFDEKTIHGVS